MHQINILKFLRNQNFQPVQKSDTWNYFLVSSFTFSASSHLDLLKYIIFYVDSILILPVWKKKITSQRAEEPWKQCAPLCTEPSAKIWIKLEWYQYDLLLKKDRIIYHSHRQALSNHNDEFCNTSIEETYFLSVKNYSFLLSLSLQRTLRSMHREPQLYPHTGGITTFYSLQKE